MSGPYFKRDNQSGGNMSTADVNRLARNQARYAGNLQDRNRRAALINALRQQRQLAIAGGALVSALPPIHENMSVDDIKTAQRALNKYTPGYGGGDRTASGQVVRSGNTNTNAAPENPQPIAMPAPMVGGFAPGALTGLDSAAPQSPFVRAVPAAEPQPQSNGAMDGLMADNPRLRGANIEQTGAGLTTNVQSASGTRSVAIQPTGQQALDFAFDGFANQRFGKGYRDLSPDQRREILQASPANREVGTVTDTGASPFNERGERILATTGGIVRETDASQAKDINWLRQGDALLPKNAVAGIVAPEKYADPATGNRVAYVTRGTPDTGPQNQKRPAPSAPNVPEISKPPIQMPVDPASLARLDGAKQPEVGFQFNGMNDTAPKASPVANQSQNATTSQSKPAKKNLMEGAPSLPYPESAQPDVQSDRPMADPTYWEPKMAFKVDRPGLQKPLRTKGPLDALLKGNLSEFGAHLERADVNSTARLAKGFEKATRGTGFEGSPMDESVKFFANQRAATPSQRPSVAQKEDKSPLFTRF